MHRIVVLLDHRSSECWRARGWLINSLFFNGESVNISMLCFDELYRMFYVYFLQIDLLLLENVFSLTLIYNIATTQ